MRVGSKEASQQIQAHALLIGSMCVGGGPRRDYNLNRGLVVTAVVRADGGVHVGFASYTLLLERLALHFHVASGSCGTR